ncbi:MAG: response regulator [Candidatus Methylomirabilales bacterium]
MSKSRILVIDPDPPSCKLVTSILKAAGFDPISASDSQSGIKAAHENEPTVIILEMVLPDADGVKTCQQLKQDPALERVPVIGITGSNEAGYQEKAFRAGAEFFLTKPLRPASLLQLVQLAVKSAESAKQSATKSAGRHTKAANLRRHPRFAARVPVKAVVGPDTKSPRNVEGQTGNVCLGGILLWLQEELETGTVLRLRIELPKGPIAVEGRVAWQDTQAMSKGIRGHGVKLERFMGDADTARYKNFLSDLAAGSASKGLEFLDIPEETRQGICEYIESVSEEAKAKPSDGASIRRSYTCEKCGNSFELADSDVRPVTVEPQKRPVQAGDLFVYAHGKCQGHVMYILGGPFAPWSGDK